MSLTAYRRALFSRELPLRNYFNKIILYEDCMDVVVPSRKRRSECLRNPQSCCNMCLLKDGLNVGIEAKGDPVLVPQIKVIF